MRLKSLVVPLTIVSFVALQALLLSRLFGKGHSPAQQKKAQQESILDAQLQNLQNASVRLNEVHLRVEAKLKDLGVTQRKSQGEKAASTQYHDVHQTTQEDVADASAEAIAAMEARIISLANMVNKLGNPKSDKQEQPRTAGSTPDLNQTFDAGFIFPSGNEDGECVAGLQKGATAAVAAVVTVTFDRAEYLRRHIASLLAVHGKDSRNKQNFPLHISQDGQVPSEAVATLAKSYTSQGVHYLHHREEGPPQRLLNRKENLAYYRIANHYKFILRTFFDCFGYTRLLILEDDMELAPDFFSYFEVTGRLLDSDPTLFCISSWNDHGQSQFVRNETQLFRSDFFPGLGWMLTKGLWTEIREEWPQAYWDDWMRLNKVRKGRQCIRPEVCRTYNFGALGSSKGFYYKRFLAPIQLSSAELDWSKVDLSYLQQSRYDADLNATLAAATQLSTVDEAKSVTGDVLLAYNSQEHYEALTGRLGMLREWKDGVPRGSYRGVVMVRWENANIYLAPSPQFTAPETNVPVKIDSTGAVVRRRNLPRKVETKSAQPY